MKQKSHNIHETSEPIKQTVHEMTWEKKSQKKKRQKSNCYVMVSYRPMALCVCAC